jgi:hypothetical protein
VDNWEIKFLFPDRSKNFSLLLDVDTGSAIHPPSYLLVPEALPSKENGRGVKPTTHLHLTPRLRMRGAVLSRLFILLLICV